MLNLSRLKFKEDHFIFGTSPPLKSKNDVVPALATFVWESCPYTPQFIVRRLLIFFSSKLVRLCLGHLESIRSGILPSLTGKQDAAPAPADGASDVRRVAAGRQWGGRAVVLGAAQTSSWQAFLQPCQLARLSAALRWTRCELWRLNCIIIDTLNNRI